MASPANSIIKALSQKTQMKRAIDLRAAENDNDVRAIIKKMVEAAIVAQTSNKPRLMMRSIEELNQTVRDLVTRNISVSEKTKKNMVRKLTNLSDDMTKELESGAGSSSGGGGGGLANVLPSFDNITSAIMTASPILGYGARLLQTVGEGASNQKSKKLQRSQQERDGEIRAEDILDDSDDEDTVSGGGGSVSDSEKYLESILDQLVTLNSIWGDGTTETNNKLSELVRVEEEVKEEQRLLREQNEYDSIEAQRRQDAGGERGGAPSPTGDPEDDSMLNNILGGGMGGAIMAAVTGIAGFFGPILASAGSIAGLAAKVAIIPAVIYAIYQFIEGFFNAGEILGLDESEVTISDRIAAGIGSVVDGFLSMINSIVSTVMGWFGMDVDFMPENSKELISKSIKGMFDYYTAIFDDVLSLFGFGDKQEQSIWEGVKGIADKVMGIPVMLFNMITGFFGVDPISREEFKEKIIGGITSIVSGLLAVPLKFINWILAPLGAEQFTFEEIQAKIDAGLNSIITGVTDFISGAFSFVTGIFENFEMPTFDGVTETLDNIINGVKDFAKNIAKSVKDKFNKVMSFFGGGDDEEETKEEEKTQPKEKKSSSWFGFGDEEETKEEEKTQPKEKKSSSWFGFGDDEDEKVIEQIAKAEKTNQYIPYNDDIAQQTMRDITGVKDTSTEDLINAELDRRFGTNDSGSTKTAETFGMTNRGMDAKKQTQREATSGANIVNAPSSTNVSNTIVEGGGGNTANPDVEFREKSSGSYIGAYMQ